MPARPGRCHGDLDAPETVQAHLDLERDTAGTDVDVAAIATAHAVFHQ
jgi:hypothetical protein